MRSGTPAALLLAFLTALAADAGAQTGVVEGRVSLGIPGVDLGSVGEIVVFVGGEPSDLGALER